MQLFSADATMFLFIFAHENMKKPASKVAHNWPKSIFFSNANRPQIQPKSQFLFHENIPPWDISIMTLVLRAYCPNIYTVLKSNRYSRMQNL